MIDGGIVPQTRQVFENLRAVLAQYGADLDDALMVRVYLSDFADYAVMNAEYERWFSDPLPSRTCVGVSGLAVGALVEIDLIVGIPAAVRT